MTARGAKPRVSVITTVYNAEPFLETTLRSLLAQTFTDFEAVVVDDGSTDGSAELVQRLAANEPRIRLIRQENRGFATAVNRGLAEARGELIAFLDHDDLWRPEKLRRQVECLEQEPRTGFVGCYSALLDANLCCTGWRFGTRASGEIYRHMRFCDLIAGGSVPLVRREIIERAGRFDPAPELQGRTDWDTWLRVSRHSRFAMVEDVLVGYVRRPTNYSADYRRMIQAGAAVLAKAAATDPELDVPRMRRARARDVFGVFCLSFADGKLPEAASILRQSVAISWVPLAVAPQRWGIVMLYLLALVLPARVYGTVWRHVARRVFGIIPGAPFLPNPDCRLA